MPDDNLPPPSDSETDDDFRPWTETKQPTSGFALLFVVALFIGAFIIMGLLAVAPRPAAVEPQPVVWEGSQELSILQSVDVILPLDKGSVICWDITFTGGEAYFAIMDEGGHKVSFTYGEASGGCYTIPYDSKWYVFAINIDDYDGVHIDYRISLTNR
jgi:hypothetical protein